MNPFIKTFIFFCTLSLTTISCKKESTIPTEFYIKFKGDGHLYTFKDVAEGRLGYNGSGQYTLLINGYQGPLKDTICHLIIHDKKNIEKNKTYLVENIAGLEDNTFFFTTEIYTSYQIKNTPSTIPQTFKFIFSKVESSYLKVMFIR
ncbi:MAG: hypothetical protein KA319_11220 [Ferruginibacter sp.]|nr:hypothetical protein [Ferruginibacter sp.]